MSSNTEVTKYDGALIERLVTLGDVSKLTPEDRTKYYLQFCEATGLNPATQPVEYMTIDGRTVLYAKRAAGDQLRKKNGISVTEMKSEQLGDLYVVTVKVSDASGRVDTELGAVSTKGLQGKDLANAMMRAVTKAKRRATLSISGLGILDESELDGITGGNGNKPPAESIPIPQAKLPAKTTEIGHVTTDSEVVSAVIDLAKGARPVPPEVQKAAEILGGTVESVRTLPEEGITITKVTDKEGRKPALVETSDGQVYSTYSDTIIETAKSLQGELVKIKSHTQQKGKYVNTLLDSVEPWFSGQADQETPTDEGTPF